jgi:hypothetical protein
MGGPSSSDAHGVHPAPLDGRHGRKRAAEKVRRFFLMVMVAKTGSGCFPLPQHRALIQEIRHRLDNDQVAPAPLPRPSGGGNLLGVQKNSGFPPAPGGLRGARCPGRTRAFVPRQPEGPAPPPWFHFLRTAPVPSTYRNGSEVLVFRISIPAPVLHVFSVIFRLMGKAEKLRALPQLHTQL